MVIGLGIALVAAGVILGTWLVRSQRVLLAVIGMTALVVGAAWTIAVPQPCERESAYFCIRVDEGGVDGPTVRTLRLDTLRHATVDLEDPTWLGFAYTRAFGDVIDALGAPGSPIDALHLGGGGFTMPRYIEATRPGSRSLVLELDPVVLATARDELGLVTGDDLVVRTGDARTGITEAATDGYDLVVGDAFGGLAVPWHLTTRELVAEVAPRAPARGRLHPQRHRLPAPSVRARRAGDAPRRVPARRGAGAPDPCHPQERRQRHPHRIGRAAARGWDHSRPTSCGAARTSWSTTPTSSATGSATRRCSRMTSHRWTS